MIHISLNILFKAATPVTNCHWKVLKVKVKNLSNENSNLVFKYFGTTGIWKYTGSGAFQACKTDRFKGLPLHGKIG